MRNFVCLFAYLFMIGVTMSCSLQTKSDVGSEIHLSKPTLVARGTDADCFLQNKLNLYNESRLFTYEDLKDFNYYVEKGDIRVIEPWMNGVIVRLDEYEKGRAFADFPEANNLIIRNYRLGKSTVSPGTLTPITKLFKVKELYESIKVSEEETLRENPSFESSAVTYKLKNGKTAPLTIDSNYSLSHVERRGEWFKVKIAEYNSILNNKEGWVHCSKVDTLSEISILNIEQTFKYSILRKDGGTYDILCIEKNPSSSYLYYLTRFIQYKQSYVNRINIYATKEAFELAPKIEKEIATTKESKYFSKNWLYMYINGSYSYLPSVVN